MKKIILIFFVLGLSYRVFPFEVKVKEIADYYLDVYYPHGVEGGDVHPLRPVYLKNKLLLLDNSRIDYYDNLSKISLFPRKFDWEFVDLSRNFGVGHKYFLNRQRNKLYLYLFGYWDESIFLGCQFWVDEQNQIQYEYVTKELIEREEKKVENLGRGWHKFVVGNDWYKFENGNIAQILRENETWYFCIKDMAGTVVFDSRKSLRTDTHGLFTVNENETEIAFHLFDVTTPNIKGKKLVQLVVLQLLYSAIINDNRVRLRTEPNLTSQTVAHFDSGYQVKIKDKSTEPQTIDGESWYWYNVESEEYPDGWIYGKYLDIKER